MSDQTQHPQETDVDFTEAFFVNYDPIENKVSTAFGRVDSTGKQFGGDLIVKAASAKIRNLRQAILTNSRGRILLIDGGATLAATQAILASVVNVVCAVAMRDTKAPTPEGKQAYLVSVVTSTDKYSVGEYVYTDEPNTNAPN